MVLVPYYQYSVLLRACAQVLDLPFQCTATALTFLHRFHSAVPKGKQNENMIVAACIFCAAKLEEASIRTTDLLNLLSTLENPSERARLKQALPFIPLCPGLDTSPTNEQPDNKDKTLVGDDYYKAKERLISAEQMLLRFIRFEIVVDHPHRYALNFCRAFKTDEAFTAFVVDVLNDCLVYTNLTLHYKAEEIALGAVYFASQLCGDSHCSFGECVWESFGVNYKVLEQIGHSLMDMVVEVLSKQ